MLIVSLGIDRLTIKTLERFQFPLDGMLQRWFDQAKEEEPVVVFVAAQT